MFGLFGISSMFVRCALLWMDAGVPYVLLIHVTHHDSQYTTLCTFHMSPP